MGYSITWCAVREDIAERFISQLGLAGVGKAEEEPRSPFSMARLNTGWWLIWSKKHACPVLTKGPDVLPPGSELLICQVEEHVMASSAELWLDSRRKWRVSHEGENGPSGLEMDGELPSCFASIRTEMEGAQQAAGGDEADVDYLFEIPLKVAQSLVGFKHDESYDALLDKKFLVLTKIGSKKGLFARLLGW